MEQEVEQLLHFQAFLRERGDFAKWEKLIIADVDIDAQGKFKYILINILDPATQETKFIVRGYADCGYHADIYDRVCPSIEKKGLKCDCVGGGRIIRDAVSKRMCVFGYSQGFGMADHTKTVEILRKHLSEYNITSSNEGY